MRNITELRSKVPTMAIHTDLVGHCVVWYVGTRVSREQYYLSLLGRGGTAFRVTAQRGQVKGYMTISVSERHTARVFRILD
jgi:hypothetical protein